jgi:PilZ domain-containing protein
VTKKERRKEQRLHMVKPIEGRFGSHPVRILDLSTLGARIDSQAEMAVGERAPLTFTWRQETVSVLAEIARAGDGDEGVRFVEECGTVRRLISEANAEVRRAQAANALGLREQNVIDGDQTLTAASAAARSLAKGFIVWTFDGREWTSRKAQISDQPEDGFTVAAAEPMEQVEQLRKSYQSGDREGRDLIRRLASLSVVKPR